MTARAQTNLDEAMLLPDTEREEVARKILATIDSEVDPNAEALWDAEIESRIEEIDAGKIPFSNAFEELRAMKARLQ